MGKELIGCCGAYCGTCDPLHINCKGCKAGYDDGLRDIKKAKCKIKVCCIPKGYPTCADCPELNTCITVNKFYEKNGYKYGKYKEAIQFIETNGYEEFLKRTMNWNRAYGKLK